MKILFLVGLTAVVWLLYLGAWLVAAVWWQARRKAGVLLPAKVEWAASEMDDMSPVGNVLIFIAIVVVLATAALPVVGTIAVWSLNSDDGCPQGQKSVEDGTATPIIIKGMTYWVPNHVCVLDGGR